MLSVLEVCVCLQNRGSKGQRIMNKQEKEYNIAQSLHLVMLILRKQLRWSSFGKVGIPILRYWFRGTRSFPLDTHCFLSSKSASVCETAAAKDSEL